MARNYTGSGSNYITSTTSIGLGSPLTVACWFNNADTTSDQALVVVAQDVSFYNQLLYDGSNSYGLGDNKVIMDGSSASIATTTTVGTTGGWHHAAMSRDGGTAGVVYLDGGGKNTSAVGIANAGIGIVDIGVFRAGGVTSFSPANGDIAEVGVWNVQLTDDEILSLAKGASPKLIRPLSLVFYAPLWGRGDLIDQATQRALTVTGTVGASTSHAPVLYPRKPKVAQPTAAGGGSTYTLTGAFGTYAVNGQTTNNVVFKRSLTSDVGTYTVSGQDVQFQSGKVLAASGGTYAVTGFDAGTVYSGDISQLGTIIEPIPEEESYVFPGLNLFNGGPFDNPPAGSAVVADYGTYAVTGQDANLVYFNKNLASDTGVYTVTGQAAGMTYSAGTNRTVSADFGVYSLSGQPVNFAFTGTDPGTIGQTVLSNHKTGGGGLPSGKAMSYRRFEQINELVASEKEAKSLAEREKAEKAKEAEAAKKAARAAQAKANIPPGQREIEDVTADQLIAKITANVKDLVRTTISEELDDLHASVSALVEHAAISGGMPEPAQEVDPMVAPWKK